MLPDLSRWITDPSSSHSQLGPETALAGSKFLSCKNTLLDMSLRDQLTHYTYSLAYFDMRLVLARLLFHFDLEWTPQCEDWEKQQAFNLWVRKPLMIRLTPRTKAKSNPNH